MPAPYPYSEKEIIHGTGLPPDQSIFTSRFFKILPASVPLLGWRMPKWDNSDTDFIYWMKVMGLLLEGAYTGVDTLLGGHTFQLDNTSFSIAKATYGIMVEGEKMPNYFPTPELVSALRETDLKWVDADIFKHLPDAFTIRFPVANQFKMLLGDGWYSMDDFMLIRAKIPMERQHLFERHGEPNPNPDWEAFYWLAQSRLELTDDLQNSVYGSFIIKENTKLEDLMKSLEVWSRDTDARLKEDLSSGQMQAHLAEVAAHGTTMFQRDNAEFFRVSMESRFNYADEGYKTYIENLTFVIKFAMLMNSEQFVTTNLPVPGYKPGKVSKKAAEIRAKLLWKWGKRLKVDLPKPDPAEQHEGRHSETHKSPVRHWVRGFFRQQPYGPGRNSRKVIWVQPFWRGSDSIHA